MLLEILDQNSCEEVNIKDMALGENRLGWYYTFEVPFLEFPRGGAQGFPAGHGMVSYPQ